jgi:probable H4MPT-linked C1 transfer pathway protein
MSWLALDIGGANLKVADGLGYARAYAFAMWREPRRLAQQIRTAISEAPPCDHLAITMTGELADCFASKAEGVQFILQAVQEGSDHRHSRVYLVDGRLVAPQAALHVPHLAAASNWHALARLAGRHAPRGRGLLVDVGSTTCDLVPLVDGQVAARGTSDTTRLIAGELVYTGVERSPVCAVLAKSTYRGQTCPIVHELFATMRDVYLVLGKLPEVPGDTHTADGRPATFDAAVLRLARMMAADGTTFDAQDARRLAEDAARAQSLLLRQAIERLASEQGRPETIVLCGHGEFMAREALGESLPDVPVVSLTEVLGPMVARCGPAHALAILAREQLGG